jgi:hypothetical protein
MLVFLLLIAMGMVLLVPMAFCQDAVPGEILQRTLFIKVGDVTGTAFAVDYNGKVYFVTARHVVAGLPTTIKATIQVWKDERWIDYPTVRTIFPSSNEVDIAILETNEKIAKPFGITTDDSKGGPTMGQQVWFLGYPWGIGSHWEGNQGRIVPFIKRGTMSAIDDTNPDAIVLYIDGFNNPGFSGGPIVYWKFSQREYGILGVVQGYRNDTAKVLVNGKQVDTNILVNSGILVGYSISHAMKAIEDSQKADSHRSIQ